MIWPWVILGFTAAQRLSELVYSQKNTRALLAEGGVEAGAAHYPLIVALHVAWLICIALFLPRPAPIYWIPLALFILFQLLRVWVVVALGRYWTTRIITVPNAPLVRSGPYRFMDHPNYALVVGEIAALPLVFGEVWVAAVFSVLNAAVLALRIRAENMALAPRRAPTEGG